MEKIEYEVREFNQTGVNEMDKQQCQYCGNDASKIVMIPIHRFQKPAHKRPYKLCDTHAKSMISKTIARYSEKEIIEKHSHEPERTA